MEMSVRQRVALSIPCGILITTALTWAAFYFDNRVAYAVLLWQVQLLTLLHNLVLGPGPLLGYDERGQPMYEGTPILFFVAVLGILLGVPIYAGLSYAAMTLWRRRRRNGLR